MDPGTPLTFATGVQQEEALQDLRLRIDQLQHLVAELLQKNERLRRELASAQHPHRDLRALSTR